MRANGNPLLARLLLNRVAGVYCGAPSNILGAPGKRLAIVGGPRETTRDCAQFLQPSRSVRLLSNNQRGQSLNRKVLTLEFVGFAGAFCRVPCRGFERTRHRSAEWNQSLRDQLSGMSGCKRTRRSWRFGFGMDFRRS
jgi:hypothetical protein